MRARNICIPNMHENAWEEFKILNQHIVQATKKNWRVSAR